MAGSGEAGSGRALTISEAAEAWGVARDTVKRWVKSGAVEAGKDNLGIWRVAPGQQPPPAGLGRRGPRDAPGTTRGEAAGDALGAGAAELAVVRREVELLRERLVEVQAERDRLGELLRVALENRRREMPPGDRLRMAVERLRAALRGALEALRGPPGAAAGGDRPR